MQKKQLNSNVLQLQSHSRSYTGVLTVADNTGRWYSRHVPEEAPGGSMVVSKDVPEMVVSN
jgi:hypothetical protein